MILANEEFIDCPDCPRCIPQPGRRKESKEQDGYIIRYQVAACTKKRR